MSTLLGPLMACPRSYPFPILPRTSFLNYKPALVSASTCFASRSSLPRFPTAFCQSLGVLHPVMVPLSFWLRTGLHRVALASSVTISSLSTATPSSASLSFASLAYPHPASTHRSRIIDVACHLSVQALRRAFASAGVDMSDDAWATAFADC
jgi:hypothetical protein